MGGANTQTPIQPKQSEVPKDGMFNELKTQASTMTPNFYGRNVSAPPTQENEVAKKAKL